MSSAETILIVDDDPLILDSTSRLLRQQGLEPLLAPNGTLALGLLRTNPVRLVLLDLGLPDMDGEQLLAEIRRLHPDVPVVIVTAQGDVDTAVRCMGSGAYDYVVKGGDLGRLLNSTARALEFHKKGRELAALRERMQSGTLKNPEAFQGLVTASERMRVLFRFIEAVAPSEEPILLFGETGTGKELFAQAVHRASGVQGPFVAANLGGMDEQMVSDTIFGHTKGAFSGADEVRKGLVATAAHGTLFLDEIGDLTPTSQVKLLRFLENREYYPLGSDQLRRSSARVVVATNRNLEALVDAGEFRKDLLYRLSTFRIDIPPLRDRPEDIPLLCAHFVANPVTSGALALLRAHPFPGNVRELRGILLRAQALFGTHPLDRPALEDLLRSPKAPSPPVTPPVPPPFEPTTPLPTIREAIEALVQQALALSGGHQTRAAALLGITPQALSKRLKRREGTV